MKKFSFALLGSFVLASAQAWVPLNSNTTQNLRSVYFVNADTGWVVGDSGIILKTIDGGVNWIRQNSGGSATLYSVQFFNANIGWAVGNSFNSTIALKTTNGGSTWTRQTLATGILYSVYFVNASVGWVVGAGGGGIILKTIDGGTNWIPQNGEKHQLYSVYFPDTSVGWAVGSDSPPIVTGNEDPNAIGIILKTTNGGTTWDTQDSGSGGLFSINGVGPQYLCSVGEVILKSLDSGLTWSSGNISGFENSSSVKMGTLRSVYYVNRDTGYAVGGGGYRETGCPPLPMQYCKTPVSSVIVATTDGGANWVSDTTETQQQLLSVHFPTPEIGYTVGTGGTILKYGGPVPILPGIHRNGSVWLRPNGGLDIQFGLPCRSAHSGFGCAGKIIVHSVTIISTSGTICFPASE